jgi:dihydroneopterin aldolase
MADTTVYLARHGDVRGAGEVFYGHEDLPLSMRGLAQAAALSARLRAADLRAAYASDLTRTVEFAQVIAAPHRLEVGRLPELREMSLGVLEGMPVAVARERHPDLAERSYSSMVDFAMPGGGESLRDVAARVRPAMTGLLERHRGDRFLVVGHHSVNRIALADALGLPFEEMFRFGQDYGCLNVIRYGARGARVVLLNDVPEHPAQVVGDRIRVCGITFQGRHGWLDAERALPRRFRADVLVRLPLGRAGASDDLGDTVDYRALAEAVVEIGTSRSFRLLEGLCQTLGRELLDRFPSFVAVEVTVHKAAPDLTGEPDEVSVSVFQRRGDA